MSSINRHNRENNRHSDLYISQTGVVSSSIIKSVFTDGSLSTSKNDFSKLFNKPEVSNLNQNTNMNECNTNFGNSKIRKVTVNYI